MGCNPTSFWWMAAHLVFNCIDRPFEIKEALPRTLLGSAATPEIQTSREQLARSVFDMTADMFDILAKATEGAATGADKGQKSGSQQEESETFHRCIHRFDGKDELTLVVGV
jgi:hypothetical protein